MLNDCTQNLEKLRSFLVGKTVQAVDPTTETESIFRISLTDGTCVRVHATDLGWWVEGTVVPGGAYLGLAGLFLDYGHHLYQLEAQFDFEVPDPKVMILGGSLVNVVAPDGREFWATAQNDWEKKLLTHPEWLGHALRAGDMWKCAFRQSEECPPELVL